MTMWTSPDAINAELEHRRESLARTAAHVRAARRLRAVRRRRRAAAQRRRGQRVTPVTAEPATTADGQSPATIEQTGRRGAKPPARRTSTSAPTTRHPV